MGFRPPEEEPNPALEHDLEHEHGRRGRLGGLLRRLIPGVPWSESASAEESFVYALPSSGQLRVHNPNGRTCIVGEKRNDIAVAVERRARAETCESANALLDEIEISVEEGEKLEIEVDAPRKWHNHAHVHLELRVPESIRASVLSANGKISAEGLRADFRARSSNGSVCISNIEGDIELETSNAKVCCSYTCGWLRARSSNGKIELGDHRGSIDAITSNGFIKASVTEVGAKGIQLATSNGRIVLELPEEVDADVDVRVENGLIRTARELIQKGRDRAGRLRGRLGAGGKPIKLRTSNGTISLR